MKFGRIQLRRVEPLSWPQGAGRCRAEWSTMEGDDQIRRCRLCRNHVYDLKGESKEEATRLVESREGRVPGAYFVRQDGRLMTKECGRDWYGYLNFGSIYGLVVILIFCFCLYQPISGSQAESRRFYGMAMSWHSAYLLEKQAGSAKKNRAKEAELKKEFANAVRLLDRDESL